MREVSGVVRGAALTWSSRRAVAGDIYSPGPESGGTKSTEAQESDEQGQP